jgi:hypothetical protein
MTEVKKYSGSCHCGKVRYEVTTELASVATCNCSICSRKGTVLTFVAAEQFNLLSGEDALTDYQFNKMKIHHLFCSVCGVSSFARGIAPGGKPMIAINARCLEGVALNELPTKEFDGKSL